MIQTAFLSFLNSYLANQLSAVYRFPLTHNSLDHCYMILQLLNYSFIRDDFMELFSNFHPISSESFGTLLFIHIYTRG